MNQVILQELSDWAVDCLLQKDINKFEKIEKVYDKIFNRQYKALSFWQKVTF